MLVSNQMNNLQGRRDILVSVIIPLGIPGGLDQDSLKDRIAVCDTWGSGLEFIIVRSDDIRIEAPLREFLIACRKRNFSTSMFQVSAELEWKSVMNIAFYQCHGDIVLAPDTEWSGYRPIHGTLHREFQNTSKFDRTVWRWGNNTRN